jgi:hypothetical protein
LEGGLEVGGELLLGHESFSKQRSVRDDLSDTTLGSFHRRERCRRSWTRKYRSLYSISSYGAGLAERIGNTSHPVWEVGLMVEAEVANLLGQTDEIGKMLRSMIRSLQQKS